MKYDIKFGKKSFQVENPEPHSIIWEVETALVFSNLYVTDGKKGGIHIWQGAYRTAVNAVFECYRSPKELLMYN